MIGEEEEEEEEEEGGLHLSEGMSRLQRTQRLRFLLDCKTPINKTKHIFIFI